MNKVVVYTLVILSFLNFYAFDTIMLSCPGETQIHEVHLKERIFPKYFSNIKNLSLLLIFFFKLYFKWVKQEIAKSILLIVSTFQRFPGTIENQNQPLNFLF